MLVRRRVAAALLLAGGAALALFGCAAAQQPNQIALENERPGSPSTEWDVNGAGDPTIQGFATDISAAAW